VACEREVEGAYIVPTSSMMVMMVTDIIFQDHTSSLFSNKVMMIDNTEHIILQNHNFYKYLYHLFFIRYFFHLIVDKLLLPPSQNDLPIKQNVSD